jgi:(1->4)-alpha-D-glucan 1-alpha-D-glucosylmutase
MAEKPPAPRAAPRATYRLQLHAGFTCDDAAAIVPYLARLGVSHAYCSPLLRARRGSLHGYDVVDHDAINPELGGREGFDRLVAALRAHGMGLIFDVVPNHMGVFGDDNAWWMDVLEHGPASAYATYFDIDWQPADADLAGKVLAPVLGGRYGEVLASGDLVATFEPDGGSFAVRYHGHRFPVDPRDYPFILAGAPEPLAALAREFAALPPREEGGAQGERARLALALKERLAKAAADPATREAIEACSAAISADRPGRLHALLERQAWRLAYWKVAADGINYRRFFDINELAALRMEDEEVFEATHGLTLDLAAEGAIDGLRIDHPDGLHDPALYFDRLQAGYAKRAGIARAPAAGGRPDRPLWVVVEKIAAWHEDVPVDWAVHGTTGYRFATIVNGLFVDTAAAARLERIWQAFSGERTPFEEACHDGKRAIQRTALASELTMLATELLRIARADLRSRDFTFNSLRETLREVAACMPVYRTYVAGAPSAQDLRYIEWAMAGAVRHGRETDPSVLAFVRETLTGRAPAGASPAHAARVLRFAMRFQQFTAPVAAKGVEDTAFYNYHRLVSLNEVGGEPSQFGFGVNAFHGASADRAARWPHTMLATSTHDNKRSEDVRQRINVLSEMPAAWRLELRRWRKLNRSRRRDMQGRSAPSAADECLLYQVLLGTLPGHGLAGEALARYRGRIEAYMTKAAREAKRETSWLDPGADYERALADFVRGALSRDTPNPFLDDIETQAETVSWYGALNSIAMTAIKFASPGVPDLYQGNELIDLSLVDPDNRRPVDYAVRERLLAGFEAAPVRAADVGALLADPRDGRAKLWVTWRLLQLRRLAPGLMSQGDYRGLAIRGAAQRHGIAFHRALGGQSLVVVSGRLFAGLAGAPRLPLGEAAWGDTQVEFRRTRAAPAYVNVLTGERVSVSGGVLPLATALAAFPVAVLVAGPGADVFAPGA